LGKFCWLERREGGSASSEDDAKGIAEGTKYQATRPQSSSQRIERNAPWEPRSFTEDNAFHHMPAQTTVEAKGWGEVSVADYPLVLE